MNTINRVAVALALKDTATTLKTLLDLGTSIGLAEIRLDLMQDFDLEQLIKQSPCPLVITCRAEREGGSFVGSETERLGILTKASNLGCAFVDVEWDSIDQFEHAGGSARVIVSRHYFDTMPGDVWEQYQSLRPRAYAVKLVGFARHVREAMTMLEVLARADGPVVAIAMGDAGIITRLMAPCFSSCLLTYGSLDHGQATAPGQIKVTEMIDRFALDRATADTHVEVRMVAEAEMPQVQEIAYGDGALLRIPLLVDEQEMDAVAHALEKLDSRITVIRQSAS